MGKWVCFFAGCSTDRQQALDDAMMEFLRVKGPSRKGRTLRMTITPAMMNAIWAARRFTSGASSGGSQASPQFASVLSSSYDDGGMPTSSGSGSSNSIPSNSRTGRTLHTRREWEEMKRTRQVVQDMIVAQATMDSDSEKELPWLSSEQRQVSVTWLHRLLASTLPFVVRSIVVRSNCTALALSFAASASAERQCSHQLACICKAQAHS